MVEGNSALFSLFYHVAIHPPGLLRVFDSGLQSMDHGLSGCSTFKGRTHSLSAGTIRRIAMWQLYTYNRYKSTEVLALLKTICTDWLLLQLTFFHPVQRLVAMEWARSKMRRWCGAPQTPYRRALIPLDVAVIDNTGCRREICWMLNPPVLWRCREENLKKPWRLYGEPQFRSSVTGLGNRCL